MGILVIQGVKRVIEGVGIVAQVEIKAQYFIKPSLG